MIRKIVRHGLLFGLLLWLFASETVFAGGRHEQETVNGRVSVFVSILPQKYFADRIGGGLVDTRVLVKPGQSPHSYEPVPSQIAALGKADLYFTIGVDFEKAFIPEITSLLPDLIIVESNRGVEYRKIEDYTHNHQEPRGTEENKKENHINANDPHIWLSLRNGKIIAENIKSAFIEIQPDYKNDFETNFAVLCEEIDALDKELTRLLAPLKGEHFLVFHPSFGYFGDDYGLIQEAIETGGNQPTPKQLESIISEARLENTQVIFVQPQFAKKSAEAVAGAIQGAVVPIDPLAENWLENLQYIGEKLHTGLHNVGE